MTKEEIGQLKYDEALKLLKESSERLENKEVSMDDLTAEVQKANLLAEHCKAKLKSTETEIKRILDTEG
jgi:exodeoxyribonuclease VII small subunit